MVPRNSSAASWWMNLLSCYHDIFKAKPLSKTITPSLLALVSPALAPSPSFGFENERISWKNTGVGCHYLLQGIFPTQRLNPGLLPCRQILKLPNNGFTFSPIILVSVGMPFLKESCTHVKAGFSLWDRQVFLKKNKGFEPAGVAATMASKISFFFFFLAIVLTLDLFILKWRAGTAANFKLWYIPSNSGFFVVHVMILLLECTSSITRGTSSGSPGVI